MNEALECAHDISEDYWRSTIQQAISTELATQGKIEEAFDCVRSIENETDSNLALEAISIELAKQAKIEEALDCARGIGKGSNRCLALKAISSELATQGKREDAILVIHEAIDCAQDIIDDYWKPCILRAITTEMAKQELWLIAEKTGLEISQFATRKECWKDIAEERMKLVGWQMAMYERHNLQNKEARFLYQTSLGRCIPLVEVDIFCLLELLPILANDTKTVESLLDKYFLNLLFYGKEDLKKIERLNQSLNLQWALDIFAKFQKDVPHVRLSTNLNEWINEISDEDDRDQIILWAKQVIKGRISETEFNLKLNDLLKES